MAERRNDKPQFKNLNFRWNRAHYMDFGSTNELKLIFVRHCQHSSKSTNPQPGCLYRMRSVCRDRLTTSSCMMFF